MFIRNTVQYQFGRFRLSGYYPAFIDLVSSYFDIVFLSTFILWKYRANGFYSHEYRSMTQVDCNFQMEAT